MDKNTIASSGCEVFIPSEDKKTISEIEKSITKRYKKDLWSKFIKGIKDFEMIKEGDKVAVAISGGKDSLVMAKMFQELKKHKKVNFDVEFITMDPGYHPDIKRLHDENCDFLEIPVKTFESKIFDVVGEIASDMPCFMCAKMRRGFLYSKAKELGCNKLALGHHYDDVIETTMLNVLYAGTFKTMMPKLKSSNFEDMELIRPLYFIREKDIMRWSSYSGIWPLNCACMVAAKRTSGKRYEIKELIKNLNKVHPEVEKCIFSSASNVEMGTVLGWKKNGVKHSFLEYYDE
jgi:tRNA 2-thiocytidine biosynthesis protein TtcA